MQNRASVIELDNIKIREVEDLFSEDITFLIDESSVEGYRHIKRLRDEYQNGKNRFKKQGEALYIVCNQNKIIAICGLNQDIYLLNPDIGRVRRLYVLKEYRRFGVGRILMDEVMKKAKIHYKVIVLMTDSLGAGKFYEMLGFSSDPRYENASHYLEFNK